MARTNSRREFKHYSNDPIVQKFFVKHTQRAPVLYVGPSGCLALFVDGSSVRHGIMGWEQVHSAESKTDEERQRTIILYRKEAARLAEQKFEDYRQQLDGGEYYGGGDAKLAKLKRLRDAARRARRKLRKAQAELEEDVTPEDIRKLRKHQAGLKRAGDDFRRKVGRIKL